VGLVSLLSKVVHGLGVELNCVHLHRN
jgi:hypothetical protein